MITSLSSALASFKAATDLARAALSLRDDKLIGEALRDMNDRLIDIQNGCLALQEHHFSMSDEVRDLKQKLRQLENQNIDFENYELYKTLRGGLTYRSKSPVGSTQDPVHLCANCVAAGVKTFLQPESDGFWLACRLHGRVPSDLPDRSAESLATLAGRLA